MPLDGARTKTALVLAGGGSFGAIQVGMLHSLVTHGVCADMVVGSSVGSLNGAYYAGNPTLKGIEDLGTIWRGLRRRDVFPVSWTAMLGFLVRRNFLAEPRGLRTLIENNLTYRNLEEAKIPIHIVATDILTGGTVVLSKGSAAQAIIASAAIPVVFPPVRFEDAYLVDGAISSNTAVKVAVDQGARRLIVLPTGYACARSEPPDGAVASALHALTLLIARQLLSELKELDGSSIEYFVLPPLCPLTGSPYDFSQTDALIDRAIKSTDAWISEGGLERPNVHAQLSVHKHSNQISVPA
jgi:NTE family protein